MAWPAAAPRSTSGTSSRTASATLLIGKYRAKSGAGFTLAQASAIADAWSKQYQQGEHDLRGALGADECRRLEAIQAAEREAAACAARGTVGTLLEAYGDALEAAGRSSCIKVRASLKLHVADAHPQLWAKHALDFTTDDAVTIVGAVAPGKRTRGRQGSLLPARGVFPCRHGSPGSSYVTCPAQPGHHADPGGGHGNGGAG